MDPSDLFWQFILGNDDLNSLQTPPQHPRAIYHDLCRRLEHNDPTLTHLSLEWSPAGLKMHGYCRLTKALTNNTCLEHVHFQLVDPGPRMSWERSVTVITDELSIAIHDGICHPSTRHLKTSLTSVSFSGTHFGERLVRWRPLTHCLVDLPNLRYIDLSNCRIQDEDLQCFLRNLRVVVERIRKQSPDFRPCHHIHTLDLRRNGPLDSGETVAEFLDWCPHLLHVYFPALNGACGIEELCKYLNGETADRIETLELQVGSSFNLQEVLSVFLNAQHLAIRSVGFECNLLCFSACLQVLSLERCQLGDAEAESIAKSTIYHPRGQFTLNQPRKPLEDLRLAHNNITARGATALTCAVALTKRLDLSHNRIVGDLAFLERISVLDTSLEMINIGNNVIPMHQQHRIKLWVQLNRTGARQLLRSPQGVQMEQWMGPLVSAGNQQEALDLLFSIFTERPDLCQINSDEAYV